jgi:hypothetical protein
LDCRSAARAEATMARLLPQARADDGLRLIHIRAC